MPAAHPCPYAPWLLPRMRRARYAIRGGLRPVRRGSGPEALAEAGVRPSENVDSNARERAPRYERASRGAGPGLVVAGGSRSGRASGLTVAGSSVASRLERSRLRNDGVLTDTPARGFELHRFGNPGGVPLYRCSGCGFTTTASLGNALRAHAAGSRDCPGELELAADFPQGTGDWVSVGTQRTSQAARLSRCV